MKKFIIGILAIAVLATGAILVTAQKAGGKGHRFGGRGHGHNAGMMFRGLGLTDEQKAQVKAINSASREKMSTVHDSLKAVRKQMHDLTANGAFDEAAITALAEQQALASAQLTVERMRVRSQIFALLTDEQKTKAAEMKAKFAERAKGSKHGRKAWGEKGKKDVGTDQ